MFTVHIILTFGETILISVVYSTCALQKKKSRTTESETYSWLFVSIEKNRFKSRNTSTKIMLTCLLTNWLTVWCTMIEAGKHNQEMKLSRTFCLFFIKHCHKNSTIEVFVAHISNIDWDDNNFTITFHSTNRDSTYELLTNLKPRKRPRGFSVFKLAISIFMISILDGYTLSHIP